MNLYTIVSFRRNDSSSDKASSLAAVATGVGKSNGDEALNDDDVDYEDNKEDQQRDNLGSNFVGLTSYLALNYEPPLGPFSEYVALCTICFIWNDIY